MRAGEDVRSHPYMQPYPHPHVATPTSTCSHTYITTPTYDTTPNVTTPIYVAAVTANKKGKKSTEDFGYHFSEGM